ncbi:glucan biosynthesis protein G [Coralloluteibacterium stylophorae]|uniref:Glucans biosynthesis protein D n=1 Tax=Coralloluteibacterium stylophorae TaxID=1776034 RepID=A0A8J7VTQ8_9GAMM|nr:glucan biosynthesis protein G [Coralloluteibacterium stylophorae]MBS7457055.1 glucan biosynthesis protein G [Coralloluteibacterium stylophorae]
MPSPARVRAVAHLLIALAVCAGAAGPAAAFGLQDVTERARELAAEPYAAPEATISDALAGLDYDQLRDIRYRPESMLWRATGLPFEVAFFHAGSQYRAPIRINEVSASGVREIRYAPSLFDYGRNRLAPEALEGAGFSGFRVHAAMNTPDYKDEVFSFLGATYFRGIGRDQRYGLSARGLALDTAEPSGEEFPQFREFWLEHPARESEAITVYALMDSRRVTGAYRFVVRPGASTVMEVSARLFLREPVRVLGIAPLTSMFFFGDNQPPPREDYRPAVHDSEGLSVHAGSDEWLWRPLVDPVHLQVSSFSTTNPRGFGLMQRDRAFSHYQDLEARYELRPSAWVEPRGDWGEGVVRLVEIPSPDETNDNVVVFWMPRALPDAGAEEPLALDYSISWQMQEEARPPDAWVLQTRRGTGYGPVGENEHAFTVDFVGPALEPLDAEAHVSADLWTNDNGQIVAQNVYRNEVTGGWRLHLRVRHLDLARPVEMRGLLRLDGEQVSETWSYLLPRQQ